MRPTVRLEVVDPRGRFTAVVRAGRASRLHRVRLFDEKHPTLRAVPRRTMTNAFQGVLAKLRDLREPVMPSMQAFPPLEVDQLTRELDLLAKAEAAGKRERPASDETAPDSTELDILADIERRARKGAEDYRSQLTLYEGRIRRALISGDQRVMIEAAGQNALADYLALTTDDLNHLHNDREELEGRARELRDFQVANGLRRLPRVIESREWTTRMILLAIVVILESILNGLFFAKGSESKTN